MFIYTVNTPRDVEVNFGIPSRLRENHISLLTGPNGAGKTDALAAIANVFHGRTRNPSGARITWGRSTEFRHSTSPADQLDDDHDRERVHVIAQTFSPFSRFPSGRRTPPRYHIPVYSDRQLEIDEYSCVGFHQSSRVQVKQLPFSIVERAILRLSDRPATAKVTFDVLEELGFKEGIRLKYRAEQFFGHIADAAEDSEALVRDLYRFSQTGELTLGDRYVGKDVLHRLRRELSSGDSEEVTEYIVHAINMIRGHEGEGTTLNRERFETFEFHAFKDRHGMTSDFPYLQAFSILARLELIKATGAELTPVGRPAVDLTRTSSGQQQMLCSMFGLAAALEDDSIVLIDEPELSLHPRWQMNYFRHLATALEAVKGCHVIIATHSPLIAQSAAAHNVAIIAMDNGLAQTGLLNGGVAVPSKSVEGLLADVFKTPIPNSLHISKEIFGIITRAEAGTDLDRQYSLDKLDEYLALYQSFGEGPQEMRALLEKARRVVVGSQSKEQSK